MTISELCSHVGDDNITVQELQSSLVKAETKKRDGEITFATDLSKVHQLVMPGKPDHLCLILWLPREKLPVAMR